MKSEGTIFFDDGSCHPYQILASDRRTIALKITRNGEVVVRIPLGLPLQAARELVQAKKGWIYTHVAKSRELARQKEQFQWKEGAFVPVFGKSRTLCLEPDYGKKSFLVKLKERELVISGPVEKQGGEKEQRLVEAVVKAWYKKEAKQYLQEKVSRLAGKMKVDYGRIGIRDQVSRWGSCSGKGNLNFNWRLVLLPEGLTDYVVVHELAHRRHMNHSKSFWNTVEEEMPDYRERRKALKLCEEELFHVIGD